MRVFGTWPGRVLLALGVVIAGLWVFGPYEPADLTARFEPDAFGGDLDVNHVSAPGERV